MQKPGSSNIRVSENGDAWISGYRCSSCGAVADRQTLACRKCAARGTVEEFRAGTTGKLVTWSIVHRSYPGIAVPFVSAVVELDNGPTIKGNVNGVDHADLHAGMPLTLQFDDAGGAKDKEGNGYVAYHFVAKEKELN